MDGSKKPLRAKFYGKEKEKMVIRSGDELEQIKKELENVQYRVEDIRKGERVKKSPLPFTTSTLQQEAAKTLNFSTQKTMRLAQQLYEGIDIKGNGTVGVITYLRTDSTRISQEAESLAADYIEDQYGREYIAAAGKGSPKRPVQTCRTPMKPSVLQTSLDCRLCSRSPLPGISSVSIKLIWRRFVASQMASAVYETVSVKIAGGEYLFTVAASRVKFDGFFIRVQPRGRKKRQKIMR